MFCKFSLQGFQRWSNPQNLTFSKCPQWIIDRKDIMGLASHYWFLWFVSLSIRAELEFHLLFSFDTFHLWSVSSYPATSSDDWNRKKERHFFRRDEPAWVAKQIALGLPYVLQGRKDQLEMRSFLYKRRWSFLLTDDMILGRKLYKKAIETV